MKWGVPIKTGETKKSVKSLFSNAACCYMLTDTVKKLLVECVCACVFVCERVSEREKEREKSVYVCVIARVSVCCFEFCISFDEWKLQLSLLRGVKRVWSPFEGRKVRKRRKKETQNCNFIWKKLLFYARSKDLRNKMQERSIKRFDDSHFLRRLGINAIEIFKGAKLPFIRAKKKND